MRCKHCKKPIWIHQGSMKFTYGDVHNGCVTDYLKKVMKNQQKTKPEILQDLTFIKYDLEEEDYVDIHQSKDAEI